MLCFPHYHGPTDAPNFHSPEGKICGGNEARTLGTWGSRGPRAGHGEFSKEVAGLTSTTLSTYTKYPAQHSAEKCCPEKSQSNTVSVEGNLK